MGGAVTVVLREENGKTHVQDRWTNPLPCFVNNIRFVEKSPEHILEYLNNANQETNVNPIPLAPAGYGLVVLDQQENRILSYQDYCSFGNIGAIDVKLDMTGDSGKVKNIPIGNGLVAAESIPLGMDAFYLPSDEGGAVRLREFVERGRLKYAAQWNNPDREYSGQRHETKGLSLQELTNLVKRDMTPSLAFILDIEPFEVKKYYPNDIADGERLKRDVAELGFVYSKTDEGGWSNWFRELREFEEECAMGEER
jgi:hypothetical protein